jgi:hypothetical protein
VENDMLFRDSGSCRKENVHIVTLLIKMLLKMNINNLAFPPVHSIVSKTPFHRKDLYAQSEIPRRCGE